jgi:mono/diheme cytochrome c family protein
VTTRIGRHIAGVGLCLVLAFGAAPACAEAPADKGVGPIKEVKLGPVDPAMAKAGAAVFEQKCSACHKFDERYVGPALKGVTQRRTPEYIMNMILDP